VGPSFAEELFQTRDAKECIDRYKISLIFVIEPQQKFFKDDGVRMLSSMEEAKKFTEECCQILSEKGIKFTVIDTPDLKERVAMVEKVLYEWREEHKCSCL
jgi:nicotinamide riboside kinase